MATLRGCAVGAGYFSHFHYDGWKRVPGAEIAALCDLDEAKAQAVAQRYGIPRVYTGFEQMLDAEKPDFADIVTPPPTHLELVRAAAERGIATVCQKPLAPSFAEAEAIVKICEEAGIRFAVHENWRFQPWYREIKKLIGAGAIGDLHSIYFRLRMGDGWGGDAYLARQPYFREYPRMLVYETGVHFIDAFRYLAGEVRRVYARMKKLNPVIRGEDRCVIHFEFESGAEALWDANRYNEPNFPNPRYTFGECLAEGTGGAIRLDGGANLTVQPLGLPEREHDYAREDRGFAGDCCFAFQRHFAERMLDGGPFETSGREYLKTLAVQEAVYQSAAEGRPVDIRPPRLDGGNP